MRQDAGRKACISGIEVAGLGALNACPCCSQQAERRLQTDRLFSATLTGSRAQGEWVCPECAAGKAPPARRATTARERFLQQQGVALARIEAIWRVRALIVAVHAPRLVRCHPLCKVQLLLHTKEAGTTCAPPPLHLPFTAGLPHNPPVPQEPGGDVECSFRWYGLPEDTHTGRQVSDRLRLHLCLDACIKDACTGCPAESAVAGSSAAPAAQCSAQRRLPPSARRTALQRHHLAREVFLLSSRDVASVECILRRAVSPTCWMAAWLPACGYCSPAAAPLCLHS